MRGAPLVLLFAGALLGAGGQALADPAVAELARTALTDPSEKARIAAVLSLGRRADPRATPPLIRALADPSALVRGLAASALGHRGDPLAIPALEKALRDTHETVRARARVALAQLRARPRPARQRPAMPTRARIIPHEPPLRTAPAPVHVSVSRMSQRSASGRRLTERMRELLVRQLAAEPGLAVETGGPGQYVVDGAITKLTRETRGGWIEITCEVKLTVSSASGSLLSIVSGGATVQAKGRAIDRALEARLQLEALEQAVTGIRPNLIGFLARRDRPR